MADSIVEGRLRRLIDALRREGPLHIVEVLRHHQRRRRYARSGPRRPDWASMLRPTGEHLSEAEQIADLARRAQSLLYPWLLDSDQSRTTREAVEREYAEEVRAAAADIASGRFTFLGLSVREPDRRFDWHRDYSSGKVWPLDRFDQIRFLEGDGADVKYPWELSRMTWTGSLGLSFVLDNDPSPESFEVPAAEVFREILDDWMTSNPYGYGVNWAMPMEVALRSFWLISSLALFHGAGEISHEWWKEYILMVAGHGESLYNTLEYLPNLTNHYIADCFGLLVIGALFGGSSKGRGWFTDGKRRLQRELRRQVTSDGFHYERSIPYHGLVLELYLVGAIVADRAGDPFSEESLEIIDRMATFTRNVIPAPGRKVPLLGDADDGKLLRILPGRDLYDHEYLLALHAVLRGRKPEAESLESMVLAGAGGAEPGPRSGEERSVLFEEGGVAVLRNSHLTCIVDVGPIGLHGNNDTLSYALYSADGSPWVIDPGTPCYTGDPALRNALRSTAAHNTLTVDNREIAEYAGLWRVREDLTAPEVLEFVAGSGNPGDPVILRARHHAYDRDDRGGVTHEREWRLEGNELKIVDRLTGSGVHRIGSALTLDPGVETRLDSTEIRLLRRGETDMHREVRFSSSLPFTSPRLPMAPSYGLLIETEGIVLTAGVSVPAEIEYLWRFLSDRSERD